MSIKKGKVEEEEVVLGRVSGTLKMGIVGMPNVGKSTLFNLLSKLDVPASNYSFCTIDPNVARVAVPDDRFTFLCDFWKPPSMVAATLSITDIAGLVKGASEGKGLGNAFLSHINAVDAIYHVCRAFTDKEIEHFEGSVDAVRDLETISKELILKDIQRMESEVESLRSILKRSNNDKQKKFEFDVAEKTLALLKEGIDVRAGTWNYKEIDVLNNWLLLTAKPVVYLINISEKDFIRQKNKFMKEIKEWVKKKSPGSPVIPFSATFEKKVEELQGQDKENYLKENKSRSMLDPIIEAGYKSLRLIHYFTCGHDEVKCWTIRNGTKAKPAAGEIHSDLEQGFICAEVMAYDDFKELGNEAAVKAAGKYKMQGKDYVVQDGDIIYFKSGLGKKKK